jgi:hypothetical protein
MAGPRFTIASLLGIVAVLAIGMAGLAIATTFWTSAASTVTLAFLLGSVLGAVFLAGPEKAFCLGFALFGGVYLALVDWDWLGGQFGHDLTVGLSEVAASLFPDQPVAAAPGIVVNVPVEILRAKQIRTGNFVQIGRCALSLTFAALGGFVARSLHARRDRGGNDHGPAPEASTPGPSSPMSQ